MLGQSMNSLALPKDGKVSYRFKVESEGEYTVRIALIPTQPIGRNGDLRFSVCIDGESPIVYSLKGGANSLFIL